MLAKSTEQSPQFKPKQSYQKLNEKMDQIGSPQGTLNAGEEYQKELDKNIPPKKPRRAVYIFVLTCLILMNYGNYYLQDIPQQLGDNFLDYFHKTPQDVEFLYSIYAFFAMPMTLFGGMVIASWGPRSAGLILTFLIFLSSIISWKGSLEITSTEHDPSKPQGTYIYITLGRILYGFSAEVNEVAQNSLINYWFDGKILSIAAGLAQLLNNLGQASSNLMTNRFYSIRDRLSDSYLAGVSVTGLSIALLFIFFFVDRKYEKWLKFEFNQFKNKVEKRNTLVGEQFNKEFTKEYNLEEYNEQQVTLMKLKENDKYSAFDSENDNEDLQALNDDNDKKEEDKNVNVEMENIILDEADEAQPIKLSMFKDLKYPLVWINIYLFSITSALETIWFSFITKLIVERFGYTLMEANNLVGLQSIMGTIMIPFVAVLSQKYGKKNDMYIIGFISLLASCFMLIFMEDEKSNYIYLALFFYALYQAIQDPIGWPALAICTPRSAVALSFGLAQFFNNFFGTVLPLWIGYQLRDDTPEQYTNALWTLVCISAFSLIFAIYSRFEDLKTGGVLHYPENSKHVRMLKICMLDKLRTRKELIRKYIFI